MWDSSLWPFCYCFVVMIPYSWNLVALSWDYVVYGYKIETFVTVKWMRAWNVVLPPCMNVNSRYIFMMWKYVTFCDFLIDWCYIFIPGLQIHVRWLSHQNTAVLHKKTTRLYVRFPAIQFPRKNLIGLIQVRSNYWNATCVTSVSRNRHSIFGRTRARCLSNAMYVVDLSTDRGT